MEYTNIRSVWIFDCQPSTTQSLDCENFYSPNVGSQPSEHWLNEVRWSLAVLAALQGLCHCLRGLSDTQKILSQSIIAQLKYVFFMWIILNVIEKPKKERCFRFFHFTFYEVLKRYIWNFDKYFFVVLNVRVNPSVLIEYSHSTNLTTYTSSSTHPPVELWQGLRHSVQPGHSHLKGDWVNLF